MSAYRTNPETDDSRRHPNGGSPGQETIIVGTTLPKLVDIEILRKIVRSAYDQVARRPSMGMFCDRGADYARRILHYDPYELAALPRECVARFTGVGNPTRIGVSETDVGAIRAGQTVLDHACGSGLDLLLAARRVGHAGRVIGVDMTPSMEACARVSAELAGLEDIIETHTGYFEQLPVDDGIADIVISNGALNLSVDKELVIQEISRVLKPGGCLFLSELVLTQALPPNSYHHPRLWVAGYTGALTEQNLCFQFRRAEYRDVRIVHRFGFFDETGILDGVDSRRFVRPVNLFARKSRRRQTKIRRGNRGVS